MDNLAIQPTRRRRKGGFKRPGVQPVKTQYTLFAEVKKRVIEKWDDRSGNTLKVNFVKVFYLSSGSYDECLNRFKARLRVVQERLTHFVLMRIKDNSTLLPTESCTFYHVDPCYYDGIFGENIRVDEMKRFKIYRIINILEEEQKDLYNYMNDLVKQCDVQGRHSIYRCNV